MYNVDSYKENILKLMDLYRELIQQKDSLSKEDLEQVEKDFSDEFQDLYDLMERYNI